MRGLQLPIGTDDEGRLMLVEDDSEQLEKVIMLALCDCTSSNAFQQLGIPLDTIFDINDSFVQGRVEEYLDRLFRRFEREGRARLLEVVPDTSLNEHGEAVLEVRYINLKTRTPKTLAFGLSRTGSVRILEE